MVLKSNLCERPIKLLVDTGASLSLISRDLVKKDTYKKDIQINLYGLVGKEASIQTEGITYAILCLGNQLLDTTFHIVDKKYAGPGDGYLGYDFLSLYKTNIDLGKMKIHIKLEDIVQPKIKLPENEQHFLKELAENYDFTEPESTSIQKINQEFGQNKYFKTSGFHTKKFEKRDETKIHRIEPEGKHFYGINFQNCTRAEEIFEKLNLEHCNEKEKKFISNICNEFSQQFYLDGDTLGSTDIVQHYIYHI